MSCNSQLFTTFDFRKDQVRVLGPDIRFCGFVVDRKIFFNGPNERLNAGESSAANAFTRDLAKPTLDHVEPGTTGRREMHMEPRMTLEPTPNLGRFMSTVVIDDQVEVQF